MANVPSGYSGASGISQIRLRTNEPTVPSDAQILSLMNAGVEQVAAELGPVRLNAYYPTNVGQLIQTLDADIADIIDMSWSGPGSPSNNGSLVYNMQQLEEKSFFDMTAGFPTVGNGPPQFYFIYSDFGTGPSGNLPPPLRANVQPLAGISTGASLYVANTYVNPYGESLPGYPVLYEGTITTQGGVNSPDVFGNATGYNTYTCATFNGTYEKQNASPTAIGTSFTLPGTPVSLGTPPTTPTAAYISGGQMTIQFYPAAMIGQLNVYYRARPSLWADTTSTSYTNMDTIAQEAVILWTCGRVLEARQRSDEAKDIFGPQFDATMEKQKNIIARRSVPKSGRVRDVTAIGYPGWPFGMVH